MSTSTASLREKILAADDVPSEIVHVDEWGVDLKVIGMTARARGSMIELAMDQKKGELDYNRLYPLIIVQTVVDPENDEPVFRKGDMEELLDKSGSALEKLGAVALRLSGFGDGVEELGKPS